MQDPDKIDSLYKNSTIIRNIYKQNAADYCIKP